MSARAPAQHTNWLGLLLVAALLTALVTAGSPGFDVTNDGIWTLAKHFPRSTQKSIEKKQKEQRAKDADETKREQAVPRNVDIPNLALGLYHEYAGDDWEIVAGIYKIESDHGQSNAPGVKSGRNWHGCCAGPGQFNLDAGSWQAWRRSPNHNIYDIRHTVPATVDMLRSFHDMPKNHRHWRGNDCGTVAGLSDRWVNAIKHYNNSCEYVRNVASWADTYKKQASKPRSQAEVGEVPDGLTFTRSRGCDPARDWREGTWTPEVRGFLIKMADKFDFRVSCGAHGHSRFVKGTTRESAHWTGRAFDVDEVNGQPVSPTSDTAFGHQALGFGADQVGGPHVLCSGTTPGGHPRCFTDTGHQHHWHVQP